MGGVVSDVVGGATDLVGGAVDTVKDVASSDLGKAALLAGGAYFGAPYLMGSSGAGAAGALDLGGGISIGEGGSVLGGTFTGAGGSTFGLDPSLVGLTSGSANTGLLGSAMNWASANPLTAAGLGLAGAKVLGSSGSTPSSSTSSTSIDPQMKAAYLRNLEEARATAAGLGQRQFAAFPEYSTNMVQIYMNPYQQEVIDASMGDIERQRQQQQLRDRAAAVQAKAFGGSRQGVAEALTNEAFSRTAANTAAQLRSQGFTQAQQIALQQEEARRQYEQQKLDAARNLGLERLNISSGALGIPLAKLGETKSEPIYTNTGASVLGGALTGAKLGGMIGTGNAGYGALAGGLLGLLG